MQFVTFGIDKDMNLVIQFPVFIQPYTQKPLILYQLETVPIPILDKNTKVQSYIIKNNCDFDFYFNKTNVTPTVLDGGDEIVLANWPNDKHIICNVNNDILIKIPSHPYVLVNRSVLCNCRIEADNHHLLESITTCDNKISKLIMYFTINLVLLITSTCFLI